MSRRDLLKFAAGLMAGIIWPFRKYLFAEKPGVEHPISAPLVYTEKTRCDNCGMDRNKWARTRYDFTSDKGAYHTCSIHCLAVLSMKLQTKAENVKTAEYFHPEHMLKADEAVYVIGSDAPGTMTRTSKIAFGERGEAEKFIVDHGGRIGDFYGALAEAIKELDTHMKPHH